MFRVVFRLLLGGFEVLEGIKYTAIGENNCSFCIIGHGRSFNSITSTNLPHGLLNCIMIVPTLYVCGRGIYFLGAIAQLLHFCMRNVHLLSTVPMSERQEYAQSPYSYGTIQAIMCRNITLCVTLSCVNGLL